jgi:hypothetical protein
VSDLKYDKRAEMCLDALEWSRGCNGLRIPERLKASIHNSTQAAHEALDGWLLRIRG